MKTFFTCTLALFMALSASAQFADTTLVKLNRQIVDGKWEHNAQHTLVYNANKNLISKLEQKWGGAWDNIAMETYTYNASNNLTEQLMQQWFEGVWENKLQYKLVYKYDASGKKISGTRQNWSANKWVNMQEFTYKYDATGKLQNELIEDYSTTVKAKDGTFAKIKSAQNNYTYDENGFVNSIINQAWVEAKKAFENRSRIVYGNDEKGNKLSETNEDWKSSAWYGVQNITRTLHANGKFASETYEISDGMGGFVNSKKQFHNYDLKKRHLKTDEKRWDGQVWAPATVTQCTYKKN